MIIKFGRFVWSPVSSNMINWFIDGVLLLPIYMRFMYVLAELFAFPTTVTTYAYYGFLWCLLLLSMPAIWKKITGKVLAAVVCLIGLSLLEMLIHPSSVEYMVSGGWFEYITFQSTSLLFSSVFIFVGMAASDFVQLRAVLRVAARLGIVSGACAYLLMLLQGMPLHYDDMSVAYAIGACLCLLVACWEKHDGIFCIFGGISLLIAGTRGPILCVLIAVLFKWIIFEKSIRGKVGGAVLCTAALIVVYSGLGIWLLQVLNDALSNFGISNLRLMDYINQGMLLDGSGRGDLATTLLAAIAEKPILGYGIGGDRSLLPDGYFAHNIVIEALVSLGLIGGSVFIIWVLVLFKRVLTSSDQSLKQIGIGLFCGIVIKLMLSSSAINSKEFFIFIGVCIAASASKNYGIQLQGGQKRRLGLYQTKKQTGDA